MIRSLLESWLSFVVWKQQSKLHSLFPFDNNILDKWFSLLKFCSPSRLRRLEKVMNGQGNFIALIHPHTSPYLTISLISTIESQLKEEHYVRYYIPEIINRKIMMMRLQYLACEIASCVRSDLLRITMIFVRRVLSWARRFYMLSSIWIKVRSALLLITSREWRL